MSNKIESITRTSPFGKEETCAKLTIDDTTLAFTLSGIATVGEEYTLSFWLMAETDALVGTTGDTFSATAEWQKCVTTFTAEDVDVAFGFGAAGTYYIYHPQLEVGNKATDYTPATEDMATVLDLGSYVTRAEFTTTAESIRATVEATRESLDEASEYAAQTYATKTEVEQTAGGITATVEERISVLPVGGRNLVIGSDFRGRTLTESQSECASLDGEVLTVASDGDPVAALMLRFSMPDCVLTALPGNKVTLSMDYHVEEALTFGTTAPAACLQLLLESGDGNVYLVWPGSGAELLPTAVTEGWVRKAITFDVPNRVYDSYSLTLQVFDVTGKLHLRHPMIEMGGVANPWTLAPEDKDAEVDDLRSDLSALGASTTERLAEMSLSLEEFRTTVSETYATQESVDSALTDAAADADGKFATKTEMRTEVAQTATSITHTVVEEYLAEVGVTEQNTGRNFLLDADFMDVVPESDVFTVEDGVVTAESSVKDATAILPLSGLSDYGMKNLPGKTATFSYEFRVDEALTTASGYSLGPVITLDRTNLMPEQEFLLSAAGEADLTFLDVTESDFYKRIFAVEGGETYTVVIDGVEFTATAVDKRLEKQETASGTTIEYKRYICLGNGALFDAALFEDTGEDFVVAQTALYVHLPSTSSAPVPFYGTYFKLATPSYGNAENLGTPSIYLEDEEGNVTTREETHSLAIRLPKANGATSISISHSSPAVCDEWLRKEVTLDMGDGPIFDAAVELRFQNVAGKIRFRHPMLELGTGSLGWSLAPEDSTVLVTKYSSLKQTVDGFEARVVSLEDGVDNTLTFDADGLIVKKGDGSTVQINGGNLAASISITAPRINGGTITGGTISGGYISGGTVYGAAVRTVLYDAGDYGGEIEMYHNKVSSSTLAGGIRLDTDGLGEENDESTYRMFVYTNTVGGNPFALKLQSAGGMSMEADENIYMHSVEDLRVTSEAGIQLNASGELYLRGGGGVTADGVWNFSAATVTGLKLVYA